MRLFLKRWWFLAALGLLLLVGMGAPRQLAAVPEHFPQSLLVATVLFVMALPLDAQAMYRAVRHPKAVLLGVLVNFGLLPLVAWLVSPILRPDLAIGLLVAASIPSTLASAAVWTGRAGGNDAVAILVMAVTNLSCFLVTPLWLAATTGAATKVEDMTSQLLLVAVLPILLAQAVRLIPGVKRRVREQKAALALAAQCGILTMVFLGAIRSGLQLLDAPASQRFALFDWGSMIGSVVAVHVAALWLGHALGRLVRLSRDDRIAVGFAGSQKTLMVGLELAIRYYPQAPILPVVAYHVCQLLVDTVIADRLRARGERDQLAEQP